jgi:hypothetical protein
MTVDAGGSQRQMLKNLKAEMLKCLESEAEDDDESEDEQMRKDSMNGKTVSEKM